jgi:minichromosome maintenance protein 10
VHSQPSCAPRLKSMDDLLALFDAHDENDHVEPQNKNNASCDDSTLTPYEIHGKQSTSRTSLPENRMVTKNTLVQQLQQQQQQQQQKRTSDISVDDRFGIRMINRTISSSDLMHRMIEYPYHSTSQLCAYSLSSLNTLLLEPTTIVDVATVNGTVNVWTMGIVFTNTGSRIGPSGKAFCMITIGNLTTGPTITVLLFGTSYTTYCRSVQPGKVIALIHPRLMSPKAGNDRTTSVMTFSVSDKEQLLLIADAQDYGRCKAMISSKTESGQWIPNSKSCQNYIDTRICQYCIQHRKQQPIPQANELFTGIVTPSGKISSLQQLRVQAASFPTTMIANRKNVLLSDPKNGSTLRNNRTTALCPPSNKITAKNVPPSLSTTMLERHSHQLHNQNRYTLHQSRNPMLSEKQTSDIVAKNLPASLTTKLPVPTHKTSVNPYGKQKAFTRPLQKQVETIQMTRNALATIDILQHDKKRPMNHVVPASTKENVGIGKRRLINTDAAGFNGSVPIPKPTNIFLRKTSQPSNTTLFNQPSLNRMKQGNMQQRANTVIAQQQLLASQLQHCKNIVSFNDQSRCLRKSSNILQGSTMKTVTDTLRDNLFGNEFDTKERESIIDAKSKFTSEIEAEEYARSRRIVCELEVEEHKSNNKNAKQSSQDGTTTPAIQKEWYCSVCQKSFTKEPVRCIRLQHRIKTERKLRSSKSKGEERLDISEAKVENGGLTLGTGLDWSRFTSNRIN